VVWFGYRVHRSQWGGGAYFLSIVITTTQRFELF
jgi:hypothetical protein